MNKQVVINYLSNFFFQTKIQIKFFSKENREFTISYVSFFYRRSGFSNQNWLLVVTVTFSTFWHSQMYPNAFLTLYVNSCIILSQSNCNMQSITFLYCVISMFDLTIKKRNK